MSVTLRSLYALVSHLCLTGLPEVAMPYSDMWQDCQITVLHTRPCYAKSSYRSVDPQTLHGNVHRVDHVPNGPTNSGTITTMFPLRLCGGKPLVAVTRERRYGPSRLRVNDDDVAMLCTTGLRMTSCTTNRRREKAYTQSDSTWGSADLTPRRILRLTHQGQHRSGAKSDVYDCLFGVVCSRTATERGREVAVCHRTLCFDRCRRRPTTTTTTTVGILRQVTETGHARRRTPLVVVCSQMSVRHCGGPRRHNLSCLFSFVRLCDISRL